MMSGFGEPLVSPLGMPDTQEGGGGETRDEHQIGGTVAAGPPVAVVGFGRCGSTMLMRMLRAGGIPFAPGAHPASGEHPGTPEALIASVRPGAVAKLLNPFYLDMPLPAAAADWVFLWLDRDPIQQARSWAKVCGLFGMDRPSPMKQYEVRMQWAADREAIMAELPGRVHTFRYEQFIERPLMAALAVSDALPEYNLDVFAMAAVVHDRKPECRPDLSSEDALALPDDDDWSELNAAAIAEQRRKLGLPT
jgi:hypothetical protein